MGWEWIIALDKFSLYMVISKVLDGILTPAMLACCVIYIVYHIAHTHGTMVFGKALLCLGRYLMATQNALCTLMSSLTYYAIYIIIPGVGGSPYMQYTVDVPLVRYGLAKNFLRRHFINRVTILALTCLIKGSGYSY